MSRHARLVFLGTGATPPPRGRRNATMLLIVRNFAVLFDAPPDLRVSDLPKVPSAIFLTDRDPSFVRSARRLAKATGAELAPVGRLERPVRIEPFRVTHTRSHPTYAYRIEAARVAVYAPEFFRLPRKGLAGADVAILDGSTWGRDIVFANRSGGHRDAAEAVRLAQRIGVPDIYLTHIGKRTEARAPAVLKLREDQVVTL